MWTRIQLQTLVFITAFMFSEPEMDEYLKRYYHQLLEHHKREMTRKNQILISNIETKLNGVFYVQLKTATKESGKVDEDYITRTARSFQENDSLNFDNLIPATDSGDQTKPRRYLLLGGPGTGKSTVTQMLCYQWGNRELWNNRFSLVFHLECVCH